jgi:hypothetical protein
MTDGTNQPAHWTQTWVDKGKIKVSRDATTYHSAPAALALEAVDGAAQAQVSQSFEVKGGERIKLAGWVRADGGANAMLALQSFTTDWKGIDFKVVGNAITGLDWRKAEGEVTVPTNAALKEFADGQKIRLLEVSERVLKPDRELEMKYYAGDKLHLSAEGYRLWADAMNPVLAELMK